MRHDTFSRVSTRKKRKQADIDGRIADDLAYLILWLGITSYWGDAPP
jgi:hypothetical protein